MAIHLRSKTTGSTSVTTSGTFAGETTTATDTIAVTQSLNLKTPQHARSTGYDGEYAITGVKIINPISSIDVGQEYVLIGYVIPAYWLQDNLVEFTSSDPDVASVTFGVLKGNSEGTATITCTAIGTAYTESFTVTVSEATETTYESGEIYQMPAPAASDNVTCTLWLRDCLAAAAAGGYKKMLFPSGEGTYHMTPEAILGSDTSVGTSISRTCLYIPSNLCIDMNGCTIQIDASVWTNYYENPGSGSTAGGYTFIAFGSGSAYCENSSIINGTISGEVLQLSSRTGGNEHTRSVYFYNAYNCMVKDMELCNGVGFNVGTNCSAIGGMGGTVLFKADSGYCEAGGYADDGTPREESMCWRTTDNWLNNATYGAKPTFTKMVNGQAKSKYYMLGSVWGVVGEFCDATTYDILWFNSDDEVIQVCRNNLVYYAYPYPDGFAYAHIVLHQKIQPTTSKGVANYVYAPLLQVCGTINCKIINCNIHDNTSAGVTCTGGQHNQIIGCTFKDNGFRDPSSHIDMEDHGDTMHGTIIARNNFKNNQGYVLFIVGRNVAVYNNIFSCFSRAARVYGFRIFGNIFNTALGNFVYSGDCVFAYNYLTTAHNFSPSPRNSRTAKWPGYYSFFSFDNFYNGNPANPGTCLLKTEGAT